MIKKLMPLFLSLLFISCSYEVDVSEKVLNKYTEYHEEYTSITFLPAAYAKTTTMVPRLAFHPAYTEYYVVLCKTGKIATIKDHHIEYKNFSREDTIGCEQDEYDKYDIGSIYMLTDTFEKGKELKAKYE